MTAVPAASAAAPVPVRGGGGADAAGASDATVAFAGLIVTERAAAGPVAEETRRQDADAGEAQEGGAEGSPSPLLSWLFGLMASTGRAAPAAAAGEPVAGDAAVLPTRGSGAPSQRLATAPEGAAAIAAEFAAATDDARSPVAQARVGQASPPTPADAQAAGLTPAVERAAASAADSNGVPALSRFATPEPAAAPDAEGTSGAAPPSTYDAAQLVPTLLHDLHATLQPERSVAAVASAPAAPLSALAATFADDLGERIEWQLSEGLSEARIELHPAELGAITVRVEVHGDQARVHMVAAEAATRVLLAQAMPQLRELLTGSGLNLSRSHVEAETRSSGRGHDRDAGTRVDGAVRRRVTEVLLVDAYA